MRNVSVNKIVIAAGDRGEHHLQRHCDAAQHVGRDEQLALAIEPPTHR
jgi:hypothetical protein